ncbi:MAG: PAS domain S-box protein [Tindallia sp. MSAO_Bac2]|nr:MAG: PAS domain S-box protein [Tindallia sp. MSAO_Bac2]
MSPNEKAHQYKMISDVINAAMIAKGIQAKVELIDKETFTARYSGEGTELPIVRDIEAVCDENGELICAAKVLKREDSGKEIKLNLSQEVKDIFESSYDGIWITDGEGKVLYTNRANERLSGIRREDVIGKDTRQLLNDKIFSVSATLEVLNLKKRTTIMGYNYNTNKQVLITGTPIFGENRDVIFVVNNIRDISELDAVRKKLEKKDKLIDSQKRELEELRSMKKALENDIVVKSSAMQEIFELTKRVGQFDLTALILGESGVGKEIVAENIVKNSPRKDKPYVRVNCGAIPATLLESELFGYEKGAFTGASQKGKIGMFEQANGGTILLDEVADIPIELQVKLLRALQSREINRLGGTKPIKLDVRILAATNYNIEKMVKNGEFREDLYYRLNVVTITVPPLRNRKEDIPMLITHFINRFEKTHNIQKSISAKAIEILTKYQWPGNVRELENLIENLVVLTKDETITSDDLPEKIRMKKSEGHAELEINGIMPLKEGIEKLEERLVTRAMEMYGTTRAAAEALGVDQSTVVRKLKKIYERKEE